jgi:hypothetical protein
MIHAGVVVSMSVRDTLAVGGGASAAALFSSDVEKDLDGVPSDEWRQEANLKLDSAHWHRCRMKTLLSYLLVQ